MIRRSLVLAALVALGCSAANGEAGANGGSAPDTGAVPAGPSGPRPQAGMAWVIFGTDTAFAEVARTADEREQGLMGRTALDPNHGMIFVYDEPEVLSFWMRNTLIPLDVAFLDPSFRITEIQTMEPETENLHTAREPALAALEMDKGWFAERGIGPGAVARIVWDR